MNRDNRQFENQPASESIHRELDRLTSAVCDGVSSAEDHERINALLGQSEANRRHYLKQLAVHSALTTTAGQHARARVDEALEQLEWAACRELSPAGGCLAELGARPANPSGRGARLRQFAALAAGLLITIAGVWRLTHSAPRISAGAKPDQTLTATANGSAADATGTLAARVTYLSSSVRWRDSNRALALHSGVRAGSRLAVEQGQVELTYDSGARLLLTGPSEFLVRATGGNLGRGELVARVPKKGHGFTIETPQGKIIDLGTEFGVVVDDFGISQVNVYEGRVETFPNRRSARMPAKFELTKGKALQISRDAVIPMHARRGGYERPGYRAAVGGAASEPSALTTLDYQFVGAPSVLTDWQLRGPIQATSGGLELGGVAEEGGTPRLVSERAFDPTEGPVTVVCELRLLGSSPNMAASASITTRANDGPSKQGTPWQHLLATGVRCSLRGNPGLVDGVLETGTKFEADRELTNITWEGFTGLRPDTPYRLEMRDDGVNVSFTVSLVGNPTVRKTIRCRSLYRGDRNRIAIEASEGAPVVIERLQITQGVGATPTNDPSLELEELARSEGAIATPTPDEADFAPPRQPLVLSEDFNGSELDRETWATLGQLIVVDGSVQLGEPNADRHIDTWKHRPYLLTRREFSIDQFPLTILGRVKFAENFLNGYGGSFAVMTRCDDRRATGVGWESSIVDRGVRSNFWPAALAQGRSLEVFEKLPSTPISLLATRRMEIEPRSRTYRFRVVDDGRSVTLVLIDAENPSIRGSISHAISSESRVAGRISFECCWGSPVWLDELRIYARQADLESPVAATE